jgi:O-antigen/teichoic acid export membrane protein
MFGVVFALGTAATNLLYPAFAELEGADERRRQLRLLLAGLRLGMALMLLLALPLIFIPDQLIYAWIGPGWGPSSPVLVLLAIVLILHQPAQLLSQYLVARGLQQRLAIVLLVVVVANLVLSIVLARAVGIWGVALATVITEAASAIVFIPLLVRSHGGPGYRRVATAALRPVLPALGVAVPVFAVASRLIDPRTLVELLPIGVLWTASFAACVWFLGLGDEERSALAARLGMRRLRRPLASASE